MDFTMILLILIGILLLYVLYLQVRLSLSSRTTVVVMPPATEANSGCGGAVLDVLLIFAGLLAVVFVFSVLG